MYLEAFMLSVLSATLSNSREMEPKDLGLDSKLEIRVEVLFQVILTMFLDQNFHTLRFQMLITRFTNTTALYI